MIKDRRQAFLSAARLANFFSNYQHSVEFFAENTFESDSEAQEKSLRARHFQKWIFKEILIRYTAGHSIDLLIPLLETLVDSYEHLQRQLASTTRFRTSPPWRSTTGSTSTKSASRCSACASCCTAPTCSNASWP